MADILVVDDDESMATAFENFLRFDEHDFRIASGADEAARLIAERQPDLVFMDVRMPGKDGLQALQDFRTRFPDLYVVIMTAYGTSQTSIDAIRAGAFDYLTKPLDLDQLRSVIAKALAAQRVRAESEVAGARDGDGAPSVRLVGDTAAMQDVYKMIGRLAANDVPALITGERGTGKRLVVRTIHENSARRDRPFVPVDCAAIATGEVEAALFGPNAGTVHLQSVEGLGTALQARLAQALTDSSPRPDGRARVLASTDRDLPELVRAGAFSRPLYDALSVIALRLPPLLERREDIPLLVRHFVQRFNDELDRSIKGVDDEVSRRLQEHSWPGNVGELERVIKRACIVASGDVITRDEIGERFDVPGFDRREVESALARSARTALHEQLVDRSLSSSPFHAIVDLVESTLVEEALAITHGNQVKAAEILGVNRATLRKKMPSDQNS